MPIVIMTTLLTLFAPPATWKVAHVEKDRAAQATQTFGPIVKEYSTASGGVVQVREYKCADAASGDALATVPDTAEAIVDAYCSGKLTAKKTKCAEDKGDYDAGGGLGWARDSRIVGEKVLHVFVENRAKDEKKGFAISYVGPTSGVAEFLKTTDALKPFANVKAK